ncbi:hypothetical protein GCM10018980_19760 [Streptomyces capoamus]|uniref:Glycerol-3-phosphate dehydrogenase NAD-dependent N-terminal domain-containing protein n=1 Tax=Streptomyces capoamus TaxID=68183 RepID=A0A919C415_9ACTN|nr:hypothetical protein [Streptomyces capoamus]GGW16547.1 hypothetical protein GCM10010501_33350 [Streptomyces libani subsp. rufus]GHG43113.1 hypothetical protein GCM10018980_19760 [Streptomyces capoamus]
MYARRGEIADSINSTHRNPGYFPDIELPTSVTATTDPAAVLAGADFHVQSIPAQRLRASRQQRGLGCGVGAAVVLLVRAVALAAGALHRARSRPTASRVSDVCDRPSVSARVPRPGGGPEPG